MNEFVDPLRGKVIALGVSGGIAAYKAVLLARLLSEAGADVHVVMTKNATAFIAPLTFSALTGNPVFTSLLDGTQDQEIGHIALADRVDAVVIAPATADFVARMAQGRADDALAATVLATRAPVLVAPAMNVNMWQHPATVANMATLRDRGVHVVEPGTGHLACGWTGAGRLAEPPAVLESLARLLTPHDLRGHSVLITAGPTHEWLDPVRFIGNPSSGKMGYAIAAAAARRGAEVTLVSGPTALACPAGVVRHEVTTAEEMHAATMAAWQQRPTIVLASAAVGDYRAKKPATQKIKRGGAATMTLELVQNKDILAELGKRRGTAKTPILVGFAAETENHVDNARKKLRNKRCDYVLVNDVSARRAFGADDNELTCVDADGSVVWEHASKAALAHRLLSHVSSRSRGGASKTRRTRARAT